jgi:hypothetical protein
MTTNVSLSAWKPNEDQQQIQNTKIFDKSLEDIKTGEQRSKYMFRTWRNEGNKLSKQENNP